MWRNPISHLLFSLVLLVSSCPGLFFDGTPSMLQQGGSYPISIIPDQMQFSGEVTTSANCQDPTVCSWFDGTPPGTILVGVDPGSPNPTQWNGGSATATLTLPAIYSPTLLVLKISWPVRDSKGIHSPYKNRAATILFDGEKLWDKRTLAGGSYADYYAAEHEPIFTTLVVSSTAQHKITFQVQPNTAWDISEIQISTYPYPSIYKGVGYSPYRNCQYPGGSAQPSQEQVEEDLFRLSATTNVIRTYSSLYSNALVPAAAAKFGLQVFPGAWLNYPIKPVLAEDDKEIQGIIKLACEYNVPGVIVGNEYFLRSTRTQQDVSYLLQRIQQVRNGIWNTCGKNVPITTAEIDDLVFHFQGNPPTTVQQINPIYKPIIDEIDFVMVHIYPYWSNRPIEGAAAYTVNRYKSMRDFLAQAYPGQNKWIIIGEAGWPSGRSPYREGVPTELIQRKYMLEFLPLAEQETVNFMYFDAFDELWKIEEPNGVGQRWGYSYTDRSAKYNFNSVLLPAEVLPKPNAVPKNLYLPVVNNGNGPALFRSTVYDEWPEGSGKYLPTGWMGDVNNINMDACDMNDPHNGVMAIKATFTPGGPLGWSGVMWQYPENNQGNLPEALDMSRANKVTFWAKGEKGGERIRFMVGGIGTKDDPYPDSLRPEASSGFITLTNTWQKYTINLAGKDLSHLIGGFGWATDQCANPAGATFYLDDINFEYEPGLAPAQDPRPIFMIYKNAADPANHYIPSGWMGDGQTEGRVTLSECWTENPYSPGTAIRMSYVQEVIGWAGVYWVHPSFNWGERPGGYDMRGADRVTFWARSEQPNTLVKFLVGGVGYATDYSGQAICNEPLGPYKDTVCPKIITPAMLGQAWTHYSIPLPLNRDLSRVLGAFGVILESPGAIFLDDIQYEWD